MLRLRTSTSLVWESCKHGSLPRVPSARLQSGLQSTSIWRFYQPQLSLGHLPRQSRGYRATAGMGAFGRIVRFRDETGSVQYGEVEDDQNLTKDKLQGLSVPVYGGRQPWDDDFKLTSEKKTIKEVR
jgi:hypothetical protein